jgi:hypothetical protein
METPFLLDRQRHLDREHHSAIPRRVGLSILAAICLLALLLDAFGQRSTLTRVDASAASLTVDSPERLRGGLVFTSQITVIAHQKLGDAQVQLSSGWFRGMTFNGVVPQPNSMSSSGDTVTLDYGPLDAGQSMPFWISWQTNPTTLGARGEKVSVSDGSNQLVTIQRSLVVFP